MPRMSVEAATRSFASWSTLSADGLAASVLTSFSAPVSAVTLASGRVQPNCWRKDANAAGDATASRNGCSAVAKPARICLRKLDDAMECSSEKIGTAENPAHERRPELHRNGLAGHHGAGGSRRLPKARCSRVKRLISCCNSKRPRAGLKSSFRLQSPPSPQSQSRSSPRMPPTLGSKGGLGKVCQRVACGQGQRGGALSVRHMEAACQKCDTTPCSCS